MSMIVPVVSIQDLVVPILGGAVARGIRTVVFNGRVFTSL